MLDRQQGLLYVLRVSTRDNNCMVDLVGEWPVLTYQPDGSHGRRSRFPDSSAHVLRPATRADCHQGITRAAKRVHLALEHAVKAVVIAVRSKKRRVGGKG